MRAALTCFSLLALALPSAGIAAAPAGKPPEKIELAVLEPPERTGIVHGFPVSVGLVFPDGELRSVPGGTILDDQGRSIPFEAEATGWWSADKQSVKWLLLHFNADTDRRYYFAPGSASKARGGEPLAVARGGSISVNTGPLEARISERKPGLFEQVTLHGRPIAGPLPTSLVLTFADGKTPEPGVLTNWKAVIEEATPARATVRASAEYRYRSDAFYPPAARLEVRYHFYRGESFVRVYHTFTWMLQNPAIRAREISVNLKPLLGEQGQVRLGLSEYGNDAVEAPWRPGTAFTAHQDEADHLSITADGKPLREEKRLGGWIALEAPDGRGVAIALRHAWQMYPTTLAVEDGQLQAQLYPRQGPHLSFTPEAIMPPPFFHDAVWKSFAWSQEQGHFVHERAAERWFLYTPEGAARTHELTLHFYDRDSRRSPAELNSITQHPLVLRQDPAVAMRVPFMGFQIMPADPRRYPEIERAVDTLGRTVGARWASQADYGFLRFGQMHWGAPPYPNSSLYRWLDGSQYDQQLLPWLLFMRGGGRHFYEEGEITARHLMDLGTNHFNTRGFPTGYMATAGGTPFPYVPFHTTKGTKIHYLSYYHHLTGYTRAREVRDEVIAGTLQAAAADPESVPAWYRRTGGRELYNMNVFWTNAYQETFDPRVARFAREYRQLSAEREYEANINMFRPPRIYLYTGLILQQTQWQDAKLRGIMLRHLGADLLSGPEFGGVFDVENAIGCGWAYDQSGDRRYAEVGWDLARTLADLVPEMDLTTPTPPPHFLMGNSVYRHFLMPILVGASLGHRLGLRRDAAPSLRDTFVSLDAEARPGTASGEVFVRPVRDGELKLRVLVRHGGPNPIQVTAIGPAGTSTGSLELPPAEKAPAETDGPGYVIYQRGNDIRLGNLTLRDARKGVTYRLLIAGGDAGSCALVLGDAQIVHRIPAGKRHFTQSLAGQYYAGTRAFMRTSQDEITLTATALGRSPYSIRDAQTWELLFHSSATGPAVQKLRVGKGRDIVLIATGYRIYDTRTIEGVAPYVSATREGWFDPEAATSPRE